MPAGLSMIRMPDRSGASDRFISRADRNWTVPPGTEQSGDVVEEALAFGFAGVEPATGRAWVAAAAVTLGQPGDIDVIGQRAQADPPPPRFLVQHRRRAS